MALSATDRRGLSRLPRSILWGTIAFLVVLPAVAMQFTSEVNWGSEDFVFAVVMLGGTGLALEQTARSRLSRKGKLLAAAAILFTLMVIWAELAVGLFD